MLSIRNTAVGKFLTLSRPLKVGSQGCLRCHSTPEAAPPTMIALYGSQNVSDGLTARFERRPQGR